jgi:PAS domain S-box-containing protein
VSERGDSLGSPFGDLSRHVERTTGVGGWEFDTASERLHWSSGTRHLHGVDVDYDPTIEAALSFYHPEDEGVVRRAFEDCRERGVAFELDVRLEPADGRTRYVRTTGERVERDGSTVIRGTIADVTEQRERANEQRRFQRAVEASGHAVFLTDTEGRIDYVNPAFEAVTGYDETEVVGEPPRILDSGEMPDAFYETVWESVLAGETWEGEVLNRRADGRLYHAHQTVAPIVDERGAVDAIVAIQTDVTDRKERERSLRRYETIVEALNDAVYALDEQGRFTYVNGAFVDMVGYDEGTILGSAPSLIKDEETVRRAEGSLGRLLSRDGPDNATIEIEVQPREGPPIPCEDHMGVLPYDGDSFDGSVGTLREVTERREREQQLRVMDRVLRHNLRNDMEVIRGLAETICEETPGDHATEAEAIVETSDDLLKTAEKGRAISEVLSEGSPICGLDLHEVVDRASSTVETRHPNAAIDVDSSPGVGVVAVEEIEAAIREVLTNAIVHNDQESPRVHVQVDSDETHAILTVVDDAPHIPTVEREVLTGSEQTDSLYHGSGLGLWLVHWVVSRSGGTVSFETDGSRGNVIRIELPRKRPSKS